jgi:hypothetical protein
MSRELCGFGAKQKEARYLTGRENSALARADSYIFSKQWIPAFVVDTQAPSVSALATVEVSDTRQLVVVAGSDCRLRTFHLTRDGDQSQKHSVF